MLDDIFITQGWSLVSMLSSINPIGSKELKFHLTLPPIKIDGN